MNPFLWVSSSPTVPRSHINLRSFSKHGPSCIHPKSSQTDRSSITTTPFFVLNHDDNACLGASVSRRIKHLSRTSRSSIIYLLTQRPTLRSPVNFSTISHRTPSSMPGLVADSTRIWEQNIYWTESMQCAIWDPKGKGVDVWECVRARMFLACHASQYFF